MKFTELTVHTTTEGSELIADVLWGYTTFGVAILDANDVLALQRDKDTMYWDYMDETLTQQEPQDVLVKCFIALEESDSVIPRIEQELYELAQRDDGSIPLGTLETGKRIVEGDEWLDIWKKHFRPIHLGRIVVVPEWIAYQPAAGEEIVRLDSNMAFGTGEHETTAMCVELMQEYILPQSVCIDVGCGSGILGISAVKLGAKKAYLTDIDCVAVSSARHNCELNGVADKVVVAHSNLLDDAGIVGDVMFANITGEILKMLAPSIPKNLKREGVLILSGIIASRLEMVKEAYAAVGLEIVREEKRGEWYALVLKHH